MNSPTSKGPHLSTLSNTLSSRIAPARSALYSTPKSPKNPPPASRPPPRSLNRSTTFGSTDSARKDSAALKKLPRFTEKCSPGYLTIAAVTFFFFRN
jgi:hypothetical protein